MIENKFKLSEEVEYIGSFEQYAGENYTVKTIDLVGDALITYNCQGLNTDLIYTFTEENLMSDRVAEKEEKENSVEDMDTTFPDIPSDDFHQIEVAEEPVSPDYEEEYYKVLEQAHKTDMDNTNLRDALKAVVNVL